MAVLLRASLVMHQAASRPPCSPCRHRLRLRYPSLCQRPTRQQRMQMRATLAWRRCRPLQIQHRLLTSLSTPDGVSRVLHPVLRSAAKVLGRILLSGDDLEL